MSASLVCTFIGPDRPGLVETLSQAIAAHGGNWLESSMAQLAGQFAGIIRIQVPAGQAGELQQALRQLNQRGLTVIVEQAATPGAAQPQRQLRLHLVGNDRPGIVRDVSTALASRNVNVNEMNTWLSSAPMTADMLFNASADIALPADIDVDELRDALEAIANDLIVDISLDELAG